MTDKKANHYHNNYELLYKATTKLLEAEKLIKKLEINPEEYEIDVMPDLAELNNTINSVIAYSNVVLQEQVKIEMQHIFAGRK